MRELVDCRADMINEAVAAGRPLPANLSRPWALMRAEDVPEAKAHITMSWVHPTDEETFWVHGHDHEYDEVLVLTGSNPEDPRDLPGHQGRAPHHYDLRHRLHPGRHEALPARLQPGRPPFPLPRHRALPARFRARAGLTFPV